MLSIDFLSDAGQRESRDRGSSCGCFHRKTVYANCCRGIQSMLTKRDLDAVGRIRVVSDQNSEKPVGKLTLVNGSDQFGNLILNKS